MTTYTLDWRIGASIAGGAVLLNKFLDWVIR